MWCYQISIIDYLCKFEFNKKAEAWAKRVFKKADRKKLSAVEPVFYQSRFMNFVKDEVLNSPLTLNASDNPIMSMINNAIFEAMVLRFRNNGKLIRLSEKG